MLFNQREFDKKVEIRHTASNKVIGIFPIVLGGLNYTPNRQDLFDLAWQCAVEDGLVDEVKKEDHEARIILELSEEARSLARGESNARKEVMDAHNHCMRNKEEVLGSESCGCFGCLKIMKPTDIEWFYEEAEKDGQILSTAFCPYCKADTVIGSNSGYPITPEFLKEMNDYWCGGCSK